MLIYAVRKEPGVGGAVKIKLPHVEEKKTLENDVKHLRHCLGFENMEKS